MGSWENLASATRGLSADYQNWMARRERRADREEDLEREDRRLALDAAQKAMNAQAERGTFDPDRITQSGEAAAQALLGHTLIPDELSTLIGIHAQGLIPGPEVTEAGLREQIQVGTEPERIRDLIAQSPLPGGWLGDVAGYGPPAPAVSRLLDVPKQKFEEAWRASILGGEGVELRDYFADGRQQSAIAIKDFENPGHTKVYATNFGTYDSSNLAHTIATLERLGANEGQIQEFAEAAQSGDPNAAATVAVRLATQLDIDPAAIEADANSLAGGDNIVGGPTRSPFGVGALLYTETPQGIVTPDTPAPTGAPGAPTAPSPVDSILALAKDTGMPLRALEGGGYEVPVFGGASTSHARTEEELLDWAIVNLPRYLQEAERELEGANERLKTIGSPQVLGGQRAGGEMGAGAGQMEPGWAEKLELQRAEVRRWEQEAAAIRATLDALAPSPPIPGGQAASLPSDAPVIRGPQPGFQQPGGVTFPPAQNLGPGLTQPPEPPPPPFVGPPRPRPPLDASPSARPGAAPLPSTPGQRPPPPPLERTPSIGVQPGGPLPGITGQRLPPPLLERTPTARPELGALPGIRGQRPPQPPPLLPSQPLDPPGAPLPPDMPGFMPPPPFVGPPRGPGDQATVRPPLEATPSAQPGLGTRPEAPGMSPDVRRRIAQPPPLGTTPSARPGLPSAPGQAPPRLVPPAPEQAPVPSVSPTELFPQIDRTELSKIPPSLEFLQQWQPPTEKPPGIENWLASQPGGPPFTQPPALPPFTGPPRGLQGFDEQVTVPGRRVQAPDTLEGEAPGTGLGARTRQAAAELENTSNPVRAGMDKYGQYDSAKEFVPYVTEAAELFGLDPRVIWAVIERESRYKAGAQNKSTKASGLMQLLPDTAEDLARFFEDAGDAGIFDPRSNIMAGSWYLKDEIERFGNLPAALAAYNAGRGNMMKLPEESVSLNDNDNYEALLEALRNPDEVREYKFAPVGEKWPDKEPGLWARARRKEAAEYVKGVIEILARADLEIRRTGTADQ